MRGQQLVYDKLAELGIEFDYYEHPEAYTIEEAQKYYRGEGTTLCKNLFLRNHKGNKHYLVILQASSTANIHSLEHYLKQGKLSFASPERMMKYIGVRPGSVSLFGLLNDTSHHVKLFLDESLLSVERVSFHPNDNTASLVISKESMLKFISYVGNEWQPFNISE